MADHAYALALLARLREEMDRMRATTGADREVTMAEVAKGHLDALGVIIRHDESMAQAEALRRASETPVFTLPIDTECPDVDHVEPVEVDPNQDLFDYMVARGYRWAPTA